MKLVVLTSNRHGLAAPCLDELVKSPDCTVACVILAGGGTSSRLRRLRRKLRKILAIGPLGALNGIRMRAWFRTAGDDDLEAVCARLGVPLHRTEGVNSAATVRLLEREEPDLGLSLGNGYIAPKVFSIPRHGMINIHRERLPDYQNAPSVLWPIYNNEVETGFTIHMIDKSIDTGNILYEERVPIKFCRNLRETVTTTLRDGVANIPAALRHVCEHFDELKENSRQQSDGRKYTTPTFLQFLRMVRNNRKRFEQSRSAG